MVRAMCCLLLSILLMGHGHAQSGFRVALSGETPATEVELGKPIWLNLSSDTLSPALDSVSFAELEASYHIDKSMAITIQPQTGQQHWRLRLYPYVTGPHSIPALHYVQQSSAPLSVNVIEPRDPKTGTPIQVDTQRSHSPGQAIWVREQVLFRYGVTTSSAYSQFSVNNAVSQQFDIKSFTIPAKQLKNNRFQHQMGWSIYARQAGQHRLAVPALQFISDGVPTHHFYHPPLELDIRPLPIYVPATMPVGKLQLHADQPWRFVFSHSLANFTFTLQAAGIRLSGLPDLSAQINSTSSIRTYPVDMEVNEVFTAHGVNSRQQYKIPFKSVSQGYAALQPIRVSFFDPQTGTINSTQHPPAKVFAISVWLSIFMMMLLIVLAYYLLRFLTGYLVGKWHQLVHYRTALQLLKLASNHQQLRSGITHIAMAERLPVNKTMTQIFESCTTRRDAKPIRLVGNLNTLFYDKNPAISVEQLAGEVITLCLSRHPLLMLVR